MLSSYRPVVVIERRSVFVVRWLGSQLALQRHPHAVSHSTAAAPVHAGFALQRCGNQWVARFGGVGLHVDRDSIRFGQTRRPGCLRIPGRWPARETTQLVVRPRRVRITAAAPGNGSVFSRWMQDRNMSLQDNALRR